MKACNIIVIESGLITENILITGVTEGNVAQKAESIFIEKGKIYAPAGTQWDDDNETEMLDNGFVTFGDCTVMISWPEVIAS